MKLRVESPIAITRLQSTSTHAQIRVPQSLRTCDLRLEFCSDAFRARPPSGVLLFVFAVDYFCVRVHPQLPPNLALFSRLLNGWLAVPDCSVLFSNCHPRKLFATWRRRSGNSTISSWKNPTDSCVVCTIHCWAVNIPLSERLLPNQHASYGAETPIMSSWKIQSTHPQCPQFIFGQRVFRYRRESINTAA